MLSINEKIGVHERFEAQAQAYPEKIAVQCDGEQLTYRELSCKSSHLAAYLASSIEQPGHLVGLFLGRSVDLITGVLGILKAGAAYVPIDPDYPTERIQFLLEDSGIDTIVCDRVLALKLPVDINKIVIEDLLDSFNQTVSQPVQAEAPAYVIYTSGSTGEPKGTLVSHDNVTRLFEATQKEFAFSEQDVWTLFHSISFDFSVWEIWGALLHGGRLVIVTPAVAKHTGAFTELVEREGVTILSQTPSAFIQFSRLSLSKGTNYPALRKIIFGGERLDTSHVKPWIEYYGDQQPQLINMYGITETTVHVTYRPISVEDVKQTKFSPIGHPINDLAIHLLDANDLPVNECEVGEMVITGRGVSLGYLGRKALNEQRFPMLPLGENGAMVRAYRSGDLAVFVNGEFNYAGRADDQIKVRGYRIEPREIELQLESYPEVQQCVLVLGDFGEGDKRLLAFVVPVAEKSAIADRVNSWAKQTLAEHMCPSSVIEVETIPITDHGKSDREALWKMWYEKNSESLNQQYNGSADDDISAEILKMSTDIMQYADIEIDEDLFDQGATSLTLTRLILEINNRYQINMTGVELEGDSRISNITSLVKTMVEHTQLEEDL